MTSTVWCRKLRALRPSVRIACAAVVLTGAAAACTTEDAEAKPGAVADVFFAAWSDRDFDAMVEHFTEATAASWTAPELEEVHTTLEKTGDLESIEVTASGGVIEDEAGDGEVASATVPYEIVYTSRASKRPARFEGELELELPAAEDAEWQIEWDDSLLFPGVPGAAGFRVVTEWPERANIIDRERRKVAVGPAENRHYPFGSRGGSTIGHIGSATKEDLEGLPARYRRGDLIGASGLEQGLEARLAGDPSTKLQVIDDDGERLKTVGSVEGSRGEPVRISLDMQVQAATETAYGGATGGAVVIQPKTGYVLATVGSGPFDPNNYVGATGIEPFNRAISGLYPPGSSMKVVTAAAAVDAGVVTRNTRVTGPKNYQGVRNFESGEYGSIPFSIAMQNSVNTAFAQVAEDLGAKRMYRYATAFGFNREPDLPLDIARSSFPRPEDLSDLMWGSIGQAQVVATPFQMANVAATIANDGSYIEPRIVMGDPMQRKRAVSKKTAQTITELMQLVVQGGTGTAANLGSSVPVAGKTGTAEVGQVGDLKNHAWFICFAPAGKPQVAIAVVSEFGGTGGSVAAPIARRILQAVLPLV